MHLALVPRAPTIPETHPRPWATHYYSSPRDPVASWCAIGRACTRKGAILAATRRLLDGRARLAVVHNPLGAAEVTLRLTKGRITLLGDFA